MITIIAQRGNGDRPGPDIVDPLLTNVAVQKERGRVELDTHEPQSPVTVTTRYNAAVKPGDLVKIQDAAHGPIWYGKITSIEHAPVLGGAVTNLEVLRSDAG